MDRRHFLRSLAVVSAGTTLAASRNAALAEADGAATTRRFTQQRWALDNIIRANGIDWDQPRSLYLSAPCGVEANADFAAIRARVQKMADIGPAFEATARRREAKARDAPSRRQPAHRARQLVHGSDPLRRRRMALRQFQPATSRSAQEETRSATPDYARLADHRIEAVSIPFTGKSIPAWFHPAAELQRQQGAGGDLRSPGMDSFKEAAVARSPMIAGSRAASRCLRSMGRANIESPLLGVYVSMQNWIDAGPAVVDWLLRYPEIDASKIGLTGTSFGSFFGTIVAANEPRIAATAVGSTCLEPGCHTIFEEASPTFKKRFMWMSNFTDEDKFDAFVKTLTWEGHAEKIQKPYLVVAGEADELSPLEYTERMIARYDRTWRQLVIYADSRHSVGGVPAANLGPFPPTLIADWLLARLNGRPLHQRALVRGGDRADREDRSLTARVSTIPRLRLGTPHAA